MLDLQSQTPQEWLDIVLDDFDAFLIDHAACERKASATGMNFVVRYPDRDVLLEPMIAFAREELEHFHRVWKIIQARGLRLAPDYKDPYVNGLRALMRSRGEDALLDRLLVAGVVEARGCERLGMVAEALDPGPMQEDYREMVRAESRHHALFFRLAKQLFPEVEVEVERRGHELMKAEAELVASLPLRAAVH